MKDLFLYPLPDFRGCQLRPLQPCWGSGNGYQCQSVSRLHWNPSELDWTVRTRSPTARKGLPSGKLGHSLCASPSFTGTAKLETEHVGVTMYPYKTSCAISWRQVVLVSHVWQLWGSLEILSHLTLEGYWVWESVVRYPRGVSV